MRGVAAVVMAALVAGCSTTVHRLDGEVPTSAGPARSQCDKRAWLVAAPTRYELVSDDGRSTQPRRDGIGLYRVGSDDPVSIPAAADQLGPSPMLESHEDGVRGYDRDRIISTALGGAGILTLALGTVLFVTSFETTRSSSGEEEQRINASRGTWSGVVVGLGFGLSIAGIALSPNQAERTRAETARYVFRPPKEGEKDVAALVASHNEKVRSGCRRVGAETKDVEDEEKQPDDEELDESDSAGEDDAEAAAEKDDGGEDDADEGGDERKGGGADEY